MPMTDHTPNHDESRDGYCQGDDTCPCGGCRGVREVRSDADTRFLLVGAVYTTDEVRAMAGPDDVLIGFDDEDDA